ncbi:MULTISPECIES: hypothetical protein [Niastella]|uniref:Macroglobulin domain-containing protein n=1 Tax=Niastella soli TaxID=2821487 RepID=A0ABS3Z2E1_9BACT|nr:hypothetical protein [Niastella soli]MBO9203845.1 hypothetical protein [Niastella soli]
MKCITCFLIVLMAYAVESYSQDSRTVMDQLAGRLNPYSQVKSQTSVYLRTAKDIYVSGEDCWFNAFILNAQDLSFSPIDKTLYIELQQKGSDSIVWQEMYPIDNGIAYGHVYLPQTLPEGDYYLKAYTAHSFFLDQPWFYAATSFKIIKEVRSIRHNNNSQQQAATIRKDKVQFGAFPEGGNLVAGLQNRVAFKAVGQDGRPAELNGILLKGNTAVLNFKTMHAGMGSFLFTPEKNTVYRIKLENSDSLYSFPKVQDDGLVMQLVKNDTSGLVFKIAMNHLPGRKKIFLLLQVRGTVQAIASAALMDSLEIKIPTQNISRGIAAVTLFDEQQRPLATRLVYLHAEQKLNISLSSVNKQYSQKEKVSLKIKTSDANGNPVPAVLSLRVYDHLFGAAQNTRDIVSYYSLSTQLRGRIDDPAYYFDSSHNDRLEALDLLLLTQGWQQYIWSEEALKEAIAIQQPALSDSIQGRMTAMSKSGKITKPLSLMLLNYNKSTSRLVFTDSSGWFYLIPNQLTIGPRLFIKYFSEKEYGMQIANPFDVLHSSPQPPVYEEAGAGYKTGTEDKISENDVNYLQYAKTLDEVTVVAKGRGFKDKYFGYLDSIAKYEGNTDYVGECGWLNCPDERTEIKPVEGKQYPMFTAAITSHRKVVLTNDNHKMVTYHYPVYNEEQLLKLLKMGVAKGYYQNRVFYEPDYDKETNAVTDSRNTLCWKPLLITDKNGEATVQFFCSDIRSRFVGIIEGVGDAGLLGVNKFSFSVQ